MRVTHAEAPHCVNTHTHLTALLSGTTQVSQYQKGKTNLDFTEARDSEWQRHPLGHMQVCTSLQTNNHASTPTKLFFTGRMPFLPPNQQHQSTEGNAFSAIETYTDINECHQNIKLLWQLRIHSS